MRSPETIGVEVPFPGSGSFQRTSEADHRVGVLVDAELPCRVGPRQFVQSSSGPPQTAHRVDNATRPDRTERPWKGV